MSFSDNHYWCMDLMPLCILWKTSFQVSPVTINAALSSAIHTSFPLRACKLICILKSKGNNAVFCGTHTEFTNWNLDSK